MDDHCSSCGVKTGGLHALDCPRRRPDAEFFEPDVTTPEGPIWIDMTEPLMGLPIRTVVLMANLAMNRLDARGIGEVCFHAGVRADLNLVKKENEDG